LIGLFFIALFTFLIIINRDKFSNSLACADLAQFKRIKIEDIVKHKFIDNKNHNAPTVLLEDDKEIILPLDTCSFFNFVKNGDTIIKTIGSDTINVYREGQIYNFKIYFGCSD
jgi:hypothetical protein